MSQGFVRRTRYRFLVWGGFISTALVLSGCALNRQGSREVSQLLEQYDRERAQASARYGSTPQQPADAVPAAGQQSPRRLSEETMLARLIATALDRNPDIQAAAERARS